MTKKRRIITKVCLFLLLGAAANVAVAWGCALLGDPHSGHWRNGLSSVNGFWWAIERNDTECKSRCMSKVWSGFASRYMTNSKIDELIPSWGRISRPAAPEPSVWTDPRTGRGIKIASPGFMTIVDEASGWPMRALWVGWGSPAIQQQPFATTVIHATWGIPIRQPMSAGYDGVALPLHPIWPGFLINTVFYAVIASVLALLIALPFSPDRRRRRRIKRGLCPACAYPVGTSDVCTECGKPVRMPPRPVTVRMSSP